MAWRRQFQAMTCGGWLLRLLLLWLGLCRAGWALAGAPGLVLDERQPTVLAWPAVTLLSDPEMRLTVNQVRARDRDFAPPQSPQANLGPRRDVVWLRLPVRVAVGDGRWVLDIDYPALNQADVFLVSNDQLVARYRLGANQPFDQRPLATRSHAVLLQLAPGQQHVLYLRVQTASSMVLPISLSREAAFHTREDQRQLVQGVMIGVALALLVYSLAHWVSLRNALFGLYALMLLGTSTFFLDFFGILQQHLAYQRTGLWASLSPLSVLVALPAGSLFVALALETRQERPWIHRGLMAAAAASTITFVLALAGVLDYRQTQAMATMLGPLGPVLAIPAAWRRARRGDRAALFMLIGWGTYMIGAVVMACLLRGLVPANVVTINLFQWGTLAEMLAWLRVLGLHIEAVRRGAERVEAERQALESLAHTDALTGLPNRRGLGLALDSALKHCTGDRVLAVYLLDLDGFKPINDRLGHDAGDELLVQVGKRLKHNLRATDVVARLGGDEFVIMAAGLGGEADAQVLGSKLLRAFDAPFEVLGHHCRVGLTIGFALAPLDGRDAGDLLKRADAAMYAGKQAGRHTLRRGAASIGLAGCA